MNKLKGELFVCNDVCKSVMINQIIVPATVDDVGLLGSLGVSGIVFV